MEKIDGYKNNNTLNQEKYLIAIAGLFPLQNLFPKKSTNIEQSLGSIINRSYKKNCKNNDNLILSDKEIVEQNLLSDEENSLHSLKNIYSKNSEKKMVSKLIQNELNNEVTQENKKENQKIVKKSPHSNSNKGLLSLTSKKKKDDN